MSQTPRITIGIPTMNRYENLAMLLWSISQQTYTNYDILIINDSRDKWDLRQIPFMANIITRFQINGNMIKVLNGKQRGPHISHQMIVDNADHNLILRVDDDGIMEPTYIEELVKCFVETDKSKDKKGNKMKVAAVGGIILMPNVPLEYQQQPEGWHSKVEYWGDCLEQPDGFVTHFPHLQWHTHKNMNYKPTNHLHSSFLYKKSYAIAIGGYPKDYSQVGHNEETDFSYRFHLKGYRMFIAPKALLWHNQSPTGGIRQSAEGEMNKKAMWDNDTQLFLKKWHEYWKKGFIIESTTVGGDRYKD